MSHLLRRKEARLTTLAVAAVVIGVELGLRLMGYGRGSADPLFAFDPEYGVRVLPNIEILYTPDQFLVKTYAWFGERVGLRSPQPETDPDMVVLGDSFTFCWTALEDCYVTLLETLTGFKTVNLGQPATGMVAHARLFENLIVAHGLKPRWVLVQWWGNDYNEDYGLAGAVSRPVTVGEAFNDWLFQNVAWFNYFAQRGHDSLYAFPYRLEQAGIKLWFGQSYLWSSMDMKNRKNQEGERLSRSALLYLRYLAGEADAELRVILIPTREEVYDDLTAPLLGADRLAAITEARMRLLTFCEQNGLPCLDLTSPLQGASEQVYYESDLHLNPAGNRLIAETVAKWIKP